MRVGNDVYGSGIDLKRDVNKQAAWEYQGEEEWMIGVPGHTDIPKLRAGKVGAQVPYKCIKMLFI